MPDKKIFNHQWVNFTKIYAEPFFQTERDAEWSCKCSVKPAWLQHLCRKKTLRKQRYHSKYLCMFLSSFLPLSLSLSLALSLSLSRSLSLSPLSLSLSLSLPLPPLPWFKISMKYSSSLDLQTSINNCCLLRLLHTFVSRPQKVVVDQNHWFLNVFGRTGINTHQFVEFVILLPRIP